MRKLTKLLAFAMTLLISVSSVACSKPSGPPVISNEDGTIKTNVTIEIVDVGYGTVYLNNLANAFAEKVKNVSYKDGEKGVNFIITPYKGNIKEDKLKANNYDIFFGGGGGDLQSWIRNGSVLNINDVITETLTEYGEERSIADKLYDGATDFYAQNGQIYALPMFMLPYGIMYNKDIWEEYKLYFNESNQFATAKQIEDGELGTGPDGYDGTYDDGLPRTYDEFFMIMDKLKDDIYPIVWDGKDYVFYLEDFVESLHMNAEPIDQYMLNYSFSGTATTLVDTVNSDGSVTLKAPTAISNGNGYDMFSQAGMYYATKFMERLLSDTEYWNGDNVFAESYSNIRAQLDFLKTHAVSTAPEFGMLIEGGYWEQESFEIGNINQVAVYGDEYKRENRRIAYMPMPMPTIEMVESHKGHNLVSSGAVMVVASATAEDYKIPLIKDFIQFCFTDENLRKTTITTSMFCAYDYEFGADDYAKLSPFGQSIADYMQAETTHIRMATSKNALYIENSTHFDSHRRYATKLIGSSSTITSMFDVLREKSVTAKDYFLGYKNRTQATWATDYSKYINN